MWQKVFSWIKNHKFITIIIILAIIGVGYLIYKKTHSNTSSIQYNYAKVEKGDLVITVTASGQVAALNSVTLKPKTSGEVVYVNLQNGKKVKKGELLLKLDDEDAKLALKNAQINLDDAKLTLAKMESGVGSQEGNIEAGKIKAENDLKLAYNNAVDALPNLFSNLPSIINNLHDVLYGNDLSRSYYNIDYYSHGLVIFNSSALEFGETAETAYNKATASYEKAAALYKSQNLTYSSNPSDIKNVVATAYEAIKDINDAVRATLSIVQLYQNEMVKQNLQYPTIIDSQANTLKNLFSTTSSLLSQITTIKDNIQTKEEALVNTNFSIEDQKIAVEKAEQELEIAQENLNNYSVVAPFDGILGNVANINIGDEVSGATTLGVLASQRYVVEISLPEVDAAKVKIGQKATITFDALEDFTATGEVMDIDTIGTISQGVVSYSAKILMDTNDPKIKPGMSATVEIIAQIEPNVLTIPKSALKNQNNIYYVQVLNADGTISQKEVQIGLSNDSKVEVLEGLSEGETIVVSTTSKNTSTTSSQRNSKIRIPGMGF